MSYNNLQVAALPGLNMPFRSTTYYCIFTILLLLPATSCFGLNTPATTIAHTSKEQTSVGLQLPLEVQVTDPQGIELVRCYFRYQQEANHIFVEAFPADKDNFRATLPAPESDVTSIEYCFLVRNSNKQVLRSPWYRLQVSHNPTIYPEQTGNTGLVLKTEMYLPEKGSLNQGGTGLGVIEDTGRLWLGMVGGVHQPENFETINTVSGHFGGYVQEGPGEPFLPLQGFLPLHRPGESPNLPNISSYKSTPDATTKSQTKDGYEYVGPDTDGEDWEGAFYIAPDGDDYERITAAIYQIPFSAAADYFELVTSLEEGPAQILKGFIYPTGYVWAADTYDDQVWTSFDQTKLTTSSFFYIADYVDPEESDDTYTIELEREPPPEPEPPEEEGLEWLQAIFRLLL